jgi:hypothetical protein
MGAGRITANWATNRKVPQVAFQPDWTKLAKAGPVKRKGKMLDRMQIGVLILPGTGIQYNLADRARNIGIPVVWFGQGERAHFFHKPSLRRTKFSTRSHQDALGFCAS